jgi:hypothetical protein
MAKQNRTILKTFFNTGDRPTELNFADFIDSKLNIQEDKAVQADIDAGTNDEKYITPLGAKIAARKHITVNGSNTDANGNIQINNITGTASTITGSISKSQVTGLDTDLNAKQALLLSGINIKTINGSSILGSGDIVVSGGGSAVVKLMAIPLSNFTLVNGVTAQIAFPASCDTFTLLANKTYSFKGKYLIGTGAITHTTAMSWAVTGLTVSIMEYVAKTFSSAANTQVASSSNIQISGIGSRVLNANSVSVTTTIEFEGILRTGANAGTIVPQITFSAAPTGTNVMKTGSFIEFVEVGSNTVEAFGTVA